ncbi:MAG: DUF1273 family protein [Clostridia bacterium]|nr:DUF1273 family protein [Clostridia bacterium]
MANEHRDPNSVCKCCAFTGYRPARMPWGSDESDVRCLEFKFRLREALEYLIGMGYADFMSGGALGFDLMAAEMVLSLREKYPWLRLIMVIPFDGQADRWNDAQRSRWRRAIEASDRVIHVSHRYDRGVFFRRNHRMVAGADALLAAWDGQSGGTANTVAYARRMGVKVLRLPPVKKAPPTAG